MKLNGFENMLKIIAQNKESKKIIDHMLTYLTEETITELNKITKFYEQSKKFVNSVENSFNVNLQDDYHLTYNYCNGDLELGIRFLDATPISTSNIHITPDYMMIKQLKALKNNDSYPIASVVHGNKNKQSYNLLSFVKNNGTVSVELSNKKGKKTLIKNVKTFLVKETEPTL